MTEYIPTAAEREGLIEGGILNLESDGYTRQAEAIRWLRDEWARLAGQRTIKREWGHATTNLGSFGDPYQRTSYNADYDEAAARETARRLGAANPHCAYTVVSREIVATPWVAEQCVNCGGAGRVPDWYAMDYGRGGKREKPCPECGAQETPGDHQPGSGESQHE